MPGFNAVEAAESVLVPCQNCSELSGFRILDHLLKLNTFFSGIARDGFIGVPAKNALAFAMSKLGDFLSLLFRTCLLLVGRHAYVGNGIIHGEKLQVMGPALFA